MTKTTKPAEKKIALVTKAEAAKLAASAGAPAPKAVPAPKPKPENKRITAGAEVKEWRVVRSLRESQPGYFLQGGHFKKTSRGNSFIVGAEEHFTDLQKAKTALAAKNPKQPTPAPAPAPAPVKPPVPPASKPPVKPAAEKKPPKTAPPTVSSTEPAPATRLN